MSEAPASPGGGPILPEPFDATTDATTEEPDMTAERMQKQSVNIRKRRMLVTATVGMAGIGALYTAIPFMASMMPSQRARAAGAPVEVDVGKLEPGQQLTVVWRGRPVWILRRPPDMLERMRAKTHLQRLRDPDSEVRTQQPDYARNAERARRPEYLVVIALCTHLGCVPSFRPQVAPPDLGPEWIGGYFCPCHGSRFDLAGRVFKGVPAPTNLVIPPYYFVHDRLIRVGVDSAPA